MTAAQIAFAQLAGRSPLLGWMRENHALITERMDTVRPSWDDIARTLAKLGVRDANGQTPKTEAVRRAYHRVTAALNAKGQRRRRNKMQVAAARSATGPVPMPANPEPSPAAPATMPTTHTGTPGGFPHPMPAARPPVDLAGGVNPPPKPRFGLARPR
jgi:cytochrome c551/c552